MTRSYIGLGVVLVVSAFLAPSLPAEDRTEGSPIFGRRRLDEVVSVADLAVRSPKVAEELGLTPTDVRTLADALASASPNMTSLQNRLRNARSWVAGGTAGPNTLDRARTALEEAESKRADVIRARVSPKQFRRLLQIAAQQRGYRSLTMPVVADSVELSPEQRGLIRTILDAREAERSAIVQEALARIKPGDQGRYERVLDDERAGRPIDDGDRAFMKSWFEAKARRAARIEAFEDETDSRIFNVLTRYQKKRFLALVGDLVETEGPASGASASATEGGRGGRSPG